MRSASVCPVFPAQATAKPKFPRLERLAYPYRGASGSLGFDRLCALAAAIERKLGELQDSDQTADAAKMAEVVALYEELSHAALTLKDSRFYFADPGSIVQK